MPAPGYWGNNLVLHTEQGGSLHRDLMHTSDRPYCSQAQLPRARPAAPLFYSIHPFLCYIWLDKPVARYHWLWRVNSLWCYPVSVAIQPVGRNSENSCDQGVDTDQGAVLGYYYASFHHTELPTHLMTVLAEYLTKNHWSPFCDNTPTIMGLYWGLTPMP